MDRKAFLGLVLLAPLARLVGWQRDSVHVTESPTEMEPYAMGEHTVTFAAPPETMKVKGWFLYRESDGELIDYFPR